MVLMTILPLGMMLIIPKLMENLGKQSAIQQQMSFNNQFRSGSSQRSAEQSRADPTNNSTNRRFVSTTGGHVLWRQRRLLIARGVNSESFQKEKPIEINL
jgi:predicted phage gp36 major capsid-like protein